MDAFGLEADSIIDAIEETGQKVPDAKRFELRGAIIKKLEDTWEDCMDMVRDACNGH